MVSSTIDDFFLSKEEPVKGCLLVLRSYIKNYDDRMTETMKYGMPCYCFLGKAFCYLWTDKKTGAPYILMVEGKHIQHPALESGDRARMKILPIAADQDLPIVDIDAVFELGVAYALAVSK